MNISDRLKKIREDLKMSQSSFGATLGVSRDVVNNMERNRVEIKEYMLQLICKTHQVNYFWLKDGLGEQYISAPDVIVNEAITEYGLDDFDKEIIEQYVKLDPDVREAIKTYLRNVFKRMGE